MKNIVLIGPSGSGKTSCASHIAALGGYLLIDTDELIAEGSGLTPEQIFKQYGEVVFRQLETGLLKEIKSNMEQTGPIIVATGGGMPVTEGNWQLLQEIGHIVYLRATPEILAKRVMDGPVRPMLQAASEKDQSLAERINILITQREPVYKQAKDTIDTGERSIEEVSRLILACAGQV